MTVRAAIALVTGETPVTDIEHSSAASGYRRLRTQMEADAAALGASLDGGTGAAVRHAFRTLDRTLGQAVAFLERLVPAAHRTHHPPAPVRADKRQARRWHHELRWLRDARERLRFLALDEPRVRTPDTARVSTRAATGPPVPGLRVGEHAAPPAPGNGMGVELPETLDRVLAGRRQHRTRRKAV